MLSMLSSIQWEQQLKNRGNVQLLIGQTYGQSRASLAKRLQLKAPLLATMGDSVLESHVAASRSPGPVRS